MPRRSTQVAARFTQHDWFHLHHQLFALFTKLGHKVKLWPDGQRPRHAPHESLDAVRALDHFGSIRLALVTERRPENSARSRLQESVRLKRWSK